MAKTKTKKSRYFEVKPLLKKYPKARYYFILGGRGNLLTSKNKTLRSRFIDKSLAYQAPELYRLERCSTILPSVDIVATLHGMNLPLV